MQKPEIQEIFKDYDNLLRAAFKYYARQDITSKDRTGFIDPELLSRYINQKEYIALVGNLLGNQRNLSPKLVSPDDLILVFKSQLKVKQV